MSDNMENILNNFENEFKTRLKFLSDNTGKSKKEILEKFLKYFINNNNNNNYDNNSNYITKNQWINFLDAFEINNVSVQNQNLIFDIYDTSKTGKLDYKKIVEYFTESNNNQNINNNNLNDIYKNFPKTKFNPTLKNSNSLNNINSTVTNKIFFNADLTKLDNRNYNNNNNINHKRYFQNIYDLFSQKVNTNNGLTFYLLAQKLIENSFYKIINFEFFVKSLNQIGLKIDLENCEDFFRTLDYGFSDQVRIDDLLSAFKGNLSYKRLNLLKKLFNLLINSDSSRNNIDIEKFKNVFDPNKHPDIINGIKNVDDIIHEFFYTFEIWKKIKNIKNNYISFDEFVDYFSGISPSYKDDEYFENYIYNCFISNIKVYDVNNIKNNYGFSRNKERNPFNYSETNYFDKYNNNNNNSKTPFLTTYRENNNIVDYLNNNNNNYHHQRSKSRDDYFNPLSLARSLNNNSKINSNTKYKYNPILNDYINKDGSPIYIENKITQNKNINSRNPYVSTPYQKIRRNYNVILPNLINPNKDNIYNSTVDFNSAFNSLKSILISRGTLGIFYLMKIFMVYDKNHLGIVNYEMFDIICGICKLNLSSDEKVIIFKKFDEQERGLINYNELILKLIDVLNPKRFGIIQKIYQSIPTCNEKGQISINDIKRFYKGENHPDVFSGKKNKELINNNFNEMINIFKEYNESLYKESFDYLNLNDFLNFYNLISFSVLDDEYFEFVCNNVWELNDNKIYNENQFINSGKQILNKLNNPYINSNKLF